MIKYDYISTPHEPQSEVFVFEIRGLRSDNKRLLEMFKDHLEKKFSAFLDQSIDELEGHVNEKSA